MWQVKFPTPPWSRAQVRPVQQASKPPQGEPNLGQQTSPVEPGRVEQSAVLWHSAAPPHAVPSVLPHLPELASQVRDWPEQHWSVRVHWATPGAGVPEFVGSPEPVQPRDLRRPRRLLVRYRSAAREAGRPARSSRSAWNQCS